MTRFEIARGAGGGVGGSTLRSRALGTCARRLLFGGAFDGGRFRDARPQRVEPLGQPAALARCRVPVDRALGGHLVETARNAVELRLRLCHVAAGVGGREALERVLQDRLAGAVAGAALLGLADAL